MNRGRGNINPLSGLIVTLSPQQQQAAAPSKPNRLRRSFKRTQQTQISAELGSPRSQEPEFKTPTRIQRPRAVGGFSAESPQNDSDFQQDIIWDATSPSPNRLGKRGKKPPVGVANISEIVNRIAPKHGRPTVAEPTLQQWIGDSAAIPCTPDVQVPKPKKKSPRPNGVDDLLKLAKQFDLNMFHQDEEAAEQQHQHSLELLSEDILDFENDFSSPSPPGDRPPAAKAPPPPDHHMEDDLDFLFDGPTQLVSGNLSQVASTARPSQPQWKAAFPEEASGKPAPSASSQPPGVAAARARQGASAPDEFEDDWADDDLLLDDSLVLEVTQNPQNFVAPKHCSTQKTPSPLAEAVQSAVPKVAQSAVPKVVQSAVYQVAQSGVTNNTYQRESPVPKAVQSAVPKFIQSAVPQVVQSAVPQVVQSAVYQVAQSGVTNNTYQRERPISKFVQSAVPQVVQSAVPQVVQSAVPQVVQSAVPSVGKDNVRQRTTFKLESNPSFSVARTQAAAWSNSKADPGSKKSENGARLSSEPQKAPFPRRTSVPRNGAAALSSNSSAANAARGFPTTAAVVSSRGGAEEAPAVSDLPDVDLSAFFAADPAWDDPADDHLLCEMCDDLENQTQSAESVPATRAPAAGQRAALQPSNRKLPPANRQASPRQKQTLTQTARLHGDSGRSAPPPPRGNDRKDQFTFKKPSSAVSTATSEVVGKCSAAEIELKKQQAMERRRQRLLAAGNLRAPT
ncbi:hypothetical protein PFLUV_G00001350 [Perca fluviatilis]|uniref:ETAA1 activator of ATR kinase n=1 Tax=Perca fluviatilis TaxID=8168 RepID=A0A6A5EXD8_PERFL|nr:ewing's tumor-associated antigen 1-like [Perca fluviatilis]KAF1394537.1 hypothetical protein PFLUV_G00001350 [Perca fluviatilis]